jgi:prolyl-tRNA synthetase
VQRDLSTTCPDCNKDTLKSFTSIELGHTFYLGTKYTSTFNGKYMPAHDPSALVLSHMGCYGIGISRIIAAITEVSHDGDGIIWPTTVAPWKCVVIHPKQGGSGEEAVYDGIASILGTDNVLMDDRPNLNMGWKLRDAKSVGYPFIVGLGQKWQKEGMVEFINRRTGEINFIQTSVLMDANFWKELSIQ